MNIYVLRGSTAQGSPTVGLRKSGFSILELTVTTLIVSWVIVLMSQALLEASHLSNEASQAALFHHELVEANLRRDLQVGQQIAPIREWTGAPIVLRLDGGYARYSVQKGSLYREEIATPMAPFREGPRTQRLVETGSWRWRSLGSALELQWQEPAALTTQAQSPWVRRAPRLNQAEPFGRRLVIASRQTGERNW